MTAAAPTQAQIRRAVKGALDAGFQIGAVEVTQSGTIRILPPGAIPVQREAGSNTCDNLFGESN